jgi:hypothetical protein
MQRVPPRGRCLGFPDPERTMTFPALCFKASHAGLSDPVTAWASAVGNEAGHGAGN